MFEQYLNAKPVMEYLPAYDPKEETGWFGVKACCYEGPAYQGKATKVFAYVGLPEMADSKKVPAVVLVHGGGGHAYAHWVKLWNQRGYAAIAMDTTGYFPAPEVRGLTGIESGTNEKYVRCERSGPDNDEVKNNHLPVQEQWIYHAVADTVLAHNLLRTMPQVDSKKIGIVGVSWGAVITALTIGYDTRYAFAVPIYGCGHLDKAATNLMAVFSEARTKALWDATPRLAQVPFPVLWMCALKDHAFCCYANSLSYLDTKQSGSAFSLQAEFFHSHAAAWEQEEPYYFADCVLQQRFPLVRPLEEPKNGHDISVKLELPEALEDLQVRIVYLTEPFSYDANGSMQNKYYTQKATVVGDVIHATVPVEAYCYYLEFKQKIGSKRLISTSSVVVIKRR